MYCCGKYDKRCKVYLIWLQELKLSVLNYQIHQNFLKFEPWYRHMNFWDTDPMYQNDQNNILEMQSFNSCSISDFVVVFFLFGEIYI